MKRSQLNGFWALGLVLCGAQASALPRVPWSLQKESRQTQSGSGTLKKAGDHICAALNKLLPGTMPVSAAAVHLRRLQQERQYRQQLIDLDLSWPTLALKREGESTLYSLNLRKEGLF